MRGRQLKKFVTKTIRRAIMLVAALTVSLSLVESPILTNEIALGQMDNSSEAFMLLELNDILRSLVKFVLWLLVTMQGCAIIHDIYIFIKSIHKEKN